MHNLRQSVEAELQSGILPFWLNHVIDPVHGGFHGRIANDLVIDPRAPKSLILNARILWTFSKAFSVYESPVHMAAALRAYEYLCRHFWDDELGGVYWTADHQGCPIDTKKRIYGQAFAIYALAEYAHATGSAEAVDRAMSLVALVEQAAHDDAHGGYFEAYERDWTIAFDQRLSEADLDEKKSMNTHLHILEAYATLLRDHEDVNLRLRLHELIEVFLNHIVDPASHHFILFFDESWRPRSEKTSFGHDIEGSWLLCTAAEVLGDASLRQRVRETALNLAQAVYDRALDADGGMFYEAEKTATGGTRIVDSDKHWWPQAEAVVGFLNAYELSRREHFLHAAIRSWRFIDKHIIDREHGEWFWLVSREGVPGAQRDKVGPWKCPYHNSRMCFEVMERLDRLNRGQGVNG